MNNLQNNPSPKTEIINSYLKTIEKSFRDNRSEIKLINYGTGSGKTHQFFQSICETIQKHTNIQVVGVYVAPLRQHLEVPSLVSENYPEIPVYKINSLEMRTTDECIKLYKKWIPSILNNKNFWNISSKEISREKVDEVQKNLIKVKDVINRLEYIKKVGFGDDEFYKDQTKKAVRELNSLLENFLEFLIKYKPDKDWSDECLKLVEIFFPLHLLREKSGILMLTYEKFETSIAYFNHNGKTWIKKSSPLDRYIVQQTNESRKFIIAFDEQEDGYQIMLKHKIDIISPQELAINNALSSVNRELAILFSTKNNENRAFLDFVEKNPGSFREFEEHFDKGKPIDQKLEEFAPVYHRLIVEQGNSINFLEQVVKINKGIEQSLKEITGVFDDYDESNPIVVSFEMLSRVFSKFENNRSLLIPQSLYSQISDDLMNIFSYNNLYIYNIEPLKTLFLSRSSGGHVQISEKPVSDNTTVAELIYAILAVRLQIEAIKDFLKRVLDAEDSQSRSLDIWSKQIAKVNNSSEESSLHNHRIKYLNRTYVYQSYKSIINIMEIARYQHPKNNLINHPFREVSIGSTAILASPEHKIISILKNNTNVIFLVSATGGIAGDLSTSYDMVYLKDSLLDESGQSSFSPMVKDEIKLCEKIRNYRHARRQVTASFFNDGLSSFPNSKTREVVERVEKLVLEGFINSFEQKWFGKYKKQELQNFVRFLFYLFEDDSIQETLAFTQTLRWIKDLIRYVKLNRFEYFKIEESPNHPNIFYVRVNHNKYSTKTCIKVVLYKASFDSLYDDKTRQRTYLDELVEEEDQKIFFISAYQSASKGLNPIIKTKDGTHKDFDSLVLLMDSYYTAMGPTLGKSKDSGSSLARYHFSLMKSIVHLGDSQLELKDFNKYLSQPEAIAFREQQHQILLGKGILQAIGRTERRDFPNQIVKIFINEETRKNLVNFFRYLSREEPDEIRKFSVNNYQVYLSVQEEEEKRTIQNYDDHTYDEIDAYLDFQNFREQMLNEIENFHQGTNTFDITTAWDALRNPIVFQNPVQYLDMLKRLELFPGDFIESLFYCKSDQPDFIPYLALVEDDGKRIQIVSDSLHGERIYPYQKRLYPDYLKTNTQGHDLEGNEVASVSASTDAIYRMYNKLLPQPEIFDCYIPRPHFFYDVLYPSFTEHFTERWIQKVIFEGKDWKSIKSIYGFEPLQDLRKYRKLYEKFDLYYTKGKTLFCIDVKAWSESSGNRLSQEKLQKTQNKLDKIKSSYPEFREVKGLLLNLQAPKEKINQYSPALSSGNLIYFNDHFPIASNILKDFLFH